ncbi:MAG: carboxypeptidase regulatory-like domain-containing protein, partial [Bryobacterales bacterium]|nr:carboxypeptidase regulatory-like domain-containing protein [Bryobacterales bacterium]
MLRVVSTFFISVACLCAQTGTARLRGVVLDGSGAVIPTAQVTALHQETGLSRAMAANEYGQYSF